MASPGEAGYPPCMDTSLPRSGRLRGTAGTAGTTLVELVLALSLFAIVAGIAVPPVRHALDLLAVAAARESLAAAVARTRSVAAASGGATLVLHPAGARYWIESHAGESVQPPVDLATRYQVGLSAGGQDNGRIELRFDGLGIGRLANRTVTVQRGRAEAGITLSSYGRVRRW